MLRSAREENEIGQMARALIDQFGDEAEVIAAGHADTMLDTGDVAAFETWKAVMVAIRGFRSAKAG